MLASRRRPQPDAGQGRPQLVYGLVNPGEGSVAADAPAGELPAVPVSADVARAVLEDLGAPPAAQEMDPASGDEFVPLAVSYTDEDIPEEWR